MSPKLCFLLLFFSFSWWFLLNFQETATEMFREIGDRFSEEGFGNFRLKFYWIPERHLLKKSRTHQNTIHWKIHPKFTQSSPQHKKNLILRPIFEKHLHLIKNWKKILNFTIQTCDNNFQRKRPWNTIKSGIEINSSRHKKIIKICWNFSSKWINKFSTV